MDLLFSNDLRNRPYVTNRKTAYTQLPVFSLYDYGWRSEFQLFAYSSLFVKVIDRGRYPIPSRTYPTPDDNCKGTAAENVLSFVMFEDAEAQFCDSCKRTGSC